MKTTRNSLTILFLLLYGISFAQLNNFNLSTYKLPNIDRKSLETSFSLSESGNSVSSESSLLDQNTNSTSINSDIWINYNRYLNSEKYQRNTSFDVNLSGRFAKNNFNDESISKNNYAYTSVLYQRVNRKYFQTNKFLEIDLLFDYEYQSSYSIIENKVLNTEEEQNNDKNDFRLFIPIKFGIGRIEQIQDARLAVYLFDELSKKGKISAQKTDTEVIEFAEIISRIKNKRFLDSRIARIEELEAVDSFLMAHNYLLQTDIAYFTTLADFWDYGDAPVRSSGSRFSVAVLPGGYLNTDVADLQEYLYEGLIVKAGLEFNYEKPINLFLQNSLHVNLYAGSIYGVQNDKTLSIEQDIILPNWQLGLFHNLGFYPNTRTSMNIGYSAQYFQFFDKTDVANNILSTNSKAAQFALNGEIDYYVSPKLSFNFSASLRYLMQDSQNETINFNVYYPFSDYSFYFNEVNTKLGNFNHYFHIGLTYKLF